MLGLKGKHWRRLNLTALSNVSDAVKGHGSADPVRSVLGWDSIIIFGWGSIMSPSASATALAAIISLSEFQTSSPLSSPKSFSMNENIANLGVNQSFEFVSEKHVDNNHGYECFMRMEQLGTTQIFLKGKFAPPAACIDQHLC
jgi:hypothetical protein